MEAQQQSHPATGPATPQRPVQDGGAPNHSQEAPAAGGIPLSLPMGQPPQNNGAVFQGANAGFAPPQQQTFNGNGVFPAPSMMVPPHQMMAGTNGTATKHAMNGNAISAGKASNP